MCSILMTGKGFKMGIRMENKENNKEILTGSNKNIKIKD